MRAIWALGLALTTLSPATATVPASPIYELSLTVHEGDRLIATPRLTVREGNEVQMTIGTDGDLLELTLQPTGMNDGATSVVLTAVRSQMRGEVLDRTRIETTVIVQAGQQAVIASPNERSMQEPLRLTLRVERATG